MLAFVASIGATPMDATCNDLYFEIKDYVSEGEAIYSTPAHLAVTQTQVNFTLDAPFLSRAVPCSGYSIGEYPTWSFGTDWIPCTKTDGISAAWKLVDPPGSIQLMLNWTCPR